MYILYLYILAVYSNRICYFLDKYKKAVKYKPLQCGISVDFVFVNVLYFHIIHILKILIFTCPQKKPLSTYN